MVTRKKKVTVKFEIRQSALAGIGVVMCCLFLWTFIMGVWTGQSLLAPKVKWGKETSGDSVSLLASNSGVKGRPSQSDSNMMQKNGSNIQNAKRNKPNHFFKEKAEQYGDGSVPIHIKVRRKVVKKIE